MNSQSTTQALEKIFEEVLEERIRAADLGYDLQHDLEEGWRHPLNRVHAYYHLARTSTISPLHQRRKMLIKAAALIFATIHAMDNEKEYVLNEGS